MSVQGVVPERARFVTFQGLLDIRTPVRAAMVRVVASVDFTARVEKINCSALLVAWTCALDIAWGSKHLPILRALPSD